MNTRENSEGSLSQAELERINETLKEIKNRKAVKTAEMKGHEKAILRAGLQKRDGAVCHYCHIPCGKDGMEFVRIWKKGCYGTKGKPDSGRKKLEIEHKNEYKDPEEDDIRKTERLEKLWEWNNLALACPVCNIAKSDQFSEGEFQRVGKVIEEIWRAKEPKR